MTVLSATLLSVWLAVMGWANWRRLCGPRQVERLPFAITWCLAAAAGYAVVTGMGLQWIHDLFRLAFGGLGDWLVQLQGLPPSVP